VGVLLDGFKLPFERCITFRAGNLSPMSLMLSQSHPTHACNNNDCNDENYARSKRFHDASILPLQALCKH